MIDTGRWVSGAETICAAVASIAELRIGAYEGLLLLRERSEVQNEFELRKYGEYGEHEFRAASIASNVAGVVAA